MLLERTLSGIAFSSFVGDHETTLQAEGRRLSWSGGPMESRFLDFEQLWFERQEVVFSSNGIADRTELRVRQRMRPRAVQLNRGFVN